MGKYIKIFNNHSEYEAFKASEDYITPNVSYCISENEVHYNPYVPPFFCKLTLNNGSVVELEGSGELTSAMTSAYSATVVSAEIGELCTTIGGGAFYSYTGLTSVTIPDSVTTIGEGAFGSTSLSSIVIPDSVTIIGNGAFNQCTGLTSVAIGNGVTIIGNGAFVDCTSLTSVTIGNSVETIGGAAFRNCTSLTSIDIPSGVTSIGDYAFRDCSGLTSIVCNATTAPTITNSTFQSVKTSGTLTVPSGSSGYDTWMQNANYYLGLYGWTKVEQ